MVFDRIQRRLDEAERPLAAPVPSARRQRGGAAARSTIRPDAQRTASPTDRTSRKLGV